MKQATLTGSCGNNLLWPCCSLCMLQEEFCAHAWSEQGNRRRWMAERRPHGLPWGSLRWFQEPGHGRKLGEKGKCSRELLQKGLFAVPEWLLACGRNGAPLLAFPTAPRDFCSWGSSLVSAGRRASGTYEARLGRGLIRLSWINLPWRSLSDIEMRKFQSKSIYNIQSAEDIQKLHSMTALVSESGAGWGPAEATLLPNSSRSPGETHRTPISHSGNSPQLTTTWETSYTSPPRDRVCRKNYRLPSRSSTVQCLQSHITVGTLCAPQLCYPLRHKNTSWPGSFGCCPAGLVVKISL